MRLSAVLMVLFGLLVGCTDPSDSASERSSDQPPSWVEEVYPEPGATVAIPDAVSVDHEITGPDEDVRLIVDGVDVTTYATFDAGVLRYESGDGPVVLGDGEHSAEVQRVTLPAVGADYTVLDSFRWEFRAG